MPEYDYQIATGWDNEAGFTNIESLTPASGETLPGSLIHFVVSGYGGFRREQLRFDITGGSSYAGHKSAIWTLPEVHSVAYTWLYDTYANTQNTIRTTTGGVGVYSNWNAYTRMPDPIELTLTNFGYFENVNITHTLISST